MSGLLALLRREWLEARTPFLWLPVSALGLLVAASLLASLISGFGDYEIHIRSDGEAPNVLFIDQWSERNWLARANAFRTYTAAPFYLIYLATAAFMLLGALYEERRDHSVLFWKSLPVSDLTAVLSKLVLALWVAPVVTIACAVIAQIYLLGLLSVFFASTGLGDFALLWSNAGLPGGAVQLVIGFVIQGFWVLPIAGYLLLISVSVPRMALLWALVVPIPAAILEYVAFGTRVLADGIARHTEPAALPDFTGDDERIMPEALTVADPLALLGSVDLWVGVLIGAAFIYAAARLRGIRNEL